MQIFHNFSSRLQIISGMLWFISDSQCTNVCCSQHSKLVWMTRFYEALCFIAYNVCLFQESLYCLKLSRIAGAIPHASLMEPGCWTLAPESGLERGIADYSCILQTIWPAYSNKRGPQIVDTRLKTSADVFRSCTGGLPKLVRLSALGEVMIHELACNGTQTESYARLLESFKNQCCTVGDLGYPRLLAIMASNLHPTPYISSLQLRYLLLYGHD